MRAVLCGALLALALPLGAFAQAWPQASQAPVAGWPGSDSPFAPQVRRLANGQVRVTFTVPKGFALYRDALRLSASPGWRVQPTWPAAQPDGQGHPAYQRDVTVDVPVEAVDPTLPLQLSLRFQGCEVDRLCYPPQTQTFTVPGTLTQPTLVIVGTRTCGGCKVLEQRLKTPALQALLAGWHVVRLDAEAQPDAVTRLAVQGYPQLRVYRKGDLADTAHGHKAEGLPADLVAFLTQPPAPKGPVHAVAMVP